MSLGYLNIQYTRAREMSENRYQHALRALLNRPSRHPAIAHVNKELISVLDDVEIVPFQEATLAQIATLRKHLSMHAEVGPDASTAEFLRALDDTLYGTTIDNVLFISTETVDGIEELDVLKNPRHAVRVMAHELLHYLRSKRDPQVAEWSVSSEANSDKAITVREEQMCHLYQHMLDGRAKPGPAAMAFVRNRLIAGEYVDQQTYDAHKLTSSDLLELLINV